MARTVLLTGASGFVGSHLAPALREAGFDIRAMTRHPDRYRGAGTPVTGDVSDVASLREALDGVDAAYYLVHSLKDPDFEERDAHGAASAPPTSRNCPRTCARGGRSSGCCARVRCR